MAAEGSRANAGRQFDPKLVEAFAAAMIDPGQAKAA